MNRPPLARAMSKLMSADSACPRCRYPFGLGAKRKTGAVIAETAGADSQFSLEELWLQTDGGTFDVVAALGSVWPAVDPLLGAERRALSDQSKLLRLFHVLEADLVFERAPRRAVGRAAVAVGCAPFAQGRVVVAAGCALVQHAGG